MYTKQSLREWFKKEYKLALEFTSEQTGRRIHNIDKKGARIACLAKEEVVVPISIKEMYVGVLKNRLFVIVIECISADGKAIPLLIIIPGVMIIETWFYKNITSQEVVTVSLTRYTNKGICIIWLAHFIKHNNCGPDQEWHIFLIDKATCHEAPQFILTAKANRI
jgi:hypothetical protein